MSVQKTVIVAKDGKQTNLSYDSHTLTIAHHGQHPASIPLRHVVWAQLLNNSKISISYVRKRKQMVLTTTEGVVKDGHHWQDSAGEWVSGLLHAAYEGLGVKRCRRLKILVSPPSGKGRGVQIFEQKVKPLFEAAQCHIDITFTTRRNHAFDVAKTLPLDFDVVVVVAGDGPNHEVLNGLGQHEQAAKALSIPLAPIPTGSANGTFINLLGLEHSKNGMDVVAAALNALKGYPMRTDIFSFVQGGKRTLGFMSVALGLMADLDRTENLRFMGDARFVYGFVRGLVRLKPCAFELSFHAIESDKQKMMQAAQERDQLAKDGKNPQPESEIGVNGGLPPLKYLPDDMKGWTTATKPLLYVYAGQGPYVSRDYMAFPVSMPDDGLLDLVVCEMAPRLEIVDLTNGYETGQSYWHPRLQYYKVDAFRIKPSKTGNLSIDGEEFPMEEFQVEVHKGLANFMSWRGHYVVDLPVKKIKA